MDARASWYAVRFSRSGFSGLRLWLVFLEEAKPVVLRPPLRSSSMVAASGMMVVALGVPAPFRRNRNRISDARGRAQPAIHAGGAIAYLARLRAWAQEEWEQFRELRESNGANPWEAEESGNQRALQERFHPRRRKPRGLSLSGRKASTRPHATVTPRDASTTLAYGWWRFDGLRRRLPRSRSVIGRPVRRATSKASEASITSLRFPVGAVAWYW